MRRWLTNVIQCGTLREDTASYLYGRGCKPESMRDMGFFNWNTQGIDPAPDREFTKKYGPKGEKLQQWVIWPLYTPKGVLAGFEGRAPEKKIISCYLISPDFHWNSVWIGMPQAMPLIWGGGTVWVVEGLFDLLPLQWVIPTGDVVLASRRAGLTEDQLSFLVRFARSVNMVYDRDAAGQRESQKVLRALRDYRVPCREITYGGGKDPGEIWMSGGVAALQKTFSL